MTAAQLNQAKILHTLEALQTFVQTQRASGKRIVLTQGSFDMVHIGHARYCQEAKTFGDVLIVGVDNDEKVRARKGPDRPVVPEDERMEMLTYFSSVDGVVLKPLNAPKYHLIKAVRPDVLVATEETYTSDHIQQLDKWCRKIVVLKPKATTSTSAKIRRLQIALAHKMGKELTDRISAAIEQVLRELKQQ
jgi:D-beta-D-heptose 7-phosphate kinase/D-beta-D-heptose 1-phosphate adenosyltransferase